MKKVLAVALVLGLASVASAGFTLSGPSSMHVGETVTITIGHDTEGLNILGAQISLAGSAAMSNLEIVASNQDTSFSADFGNGAFCAVALSLTATLASPVATFDVTANALGNIVVSVGDEVEVTGGSYNTNFELISLGTAQLIIQVISDPEDPEEPIDPVAFAITSATITSNMLMLRGEILVDDLVGETIYVQIGDFSGEIDTAGANFRNLGRMGLYRGTGGISLGLFNFTDNTFLLLAQGLNLAPLDCPMAIDIALVD